MLGTDARLVEDSVTAYDLSKDTPSDAGL
jgi:hypothetical protein